MMSPFKANEKCSHFKALELLLEEKSTIIIALALQ